MSLSDHPRAVWVLAAVAFIESSVFPIPPDVLLIPIILAQPNRALWVAFVATTASVLGGMLGYAIGALAFDAVGQPLLMAMGKAEYFAEFAARYNEWGAWVVLTAGLTPFPYKVITIMSGATNLPLGVFVISSIVARGLRFFIVAGLLYYFGAPIRDFIEKHLGLAFTAFVIVLLGGFAALKYF